ncbi:hypothetical protein IQ264_18585 [Phormidium sp. LEGE 05292]|uniref:hypothetical protein n=1 Tax=[Phormidium] sp. LEGE 05292 TaxID=767427 RepID=UPI001880AEEA|nr:hypothetical protein [Phormidium sp. LEGE 05292]MBE9227438.1 hypothetical protein [Phormidium sp. LEGE 05292]
MKLNLPLATALSTVAISSGVLLTNIAPSEAVGGCAFSKFKGTDAVNYTNLISLITNKLKVPKSVILGLGIASVAGLVSAGMSYQSRLANKADARTREASDLHTEVTVDTNSADLLFAPKVEEVASASEKQDLTHVG